MMKAFLQMRIALILMMSMYVAACATMPQAPPASISSEPFGALPDGEAVTLYTLTNGNGMEMRVIDYGAIILSLTAPDVHGRFDDVTLGYDALSNYLDETPYFGALIGRYGNRIGGGRFELDGEIYELAKNNGPNHLHGGVRGFDKVVWDAVPFERENGVGLIFRRTSPDMEEGYPGNLSATVTYTLTDENEIVFDYEATTDEATPVNLTQHTYFNLAGDGERDILGHVMTINADHFTPIDSTFIPTGEIRPVGGTPFDFTEPTPIGARIEQDDEQLRRGLGYDHNFVLNRSGEDSLVLAARVYEPTTGRVMEVLTTEPGMQFYSGNFLDGSLTGKDGAVYEHRYGLALETQHFPDSPNQPGFPSTILRPGETYRSTTVYRFSVKE